MRYDAIVIGAGPAGATVALMLARAGWSVAVVEKAPFPRRKVCGEFISATTLALLHEMGLGRSFLERAGPEIKRVALFAGDSVVASPLPQGRGGGWGRALGREHLDSLLLEAAVGAGAKLWQPFAAREVRYVRDGIICTIAGDGPYTELRGRVAILAHGSWERGPGATVSYAHGSSDLIAFKAHFHGSDLAPDLMPLVGFPGGYGGMVHSDGGRVSLSCCIRRDVLQQSRLLYPGRHAGEAVLAHIQSSCLGLREALRHAVRDGTWLSAGPIRPGLRRAYADGVFLAGNLAGEAHPLVAEGISMAMQSAWLIARAVLDEGEGIFSSSGRDRPGATYTAAWNRFFAARVRAAALFAHVALRPQIGRRLLPVIERFPQLLTLGAQLSGKTRQVVPAS
jgi:flavin-dependent dehydrogenase